MADISGIRPGDAPPWSALDQTARTVHTPCGAGHMVWRVWGEGRPLVLLHGGAGSWLHWLPTIAAFRGGRMVVAPDLPGLGGSADLPAEQAGDGGAAVVAAGLHAVLGPDAEVDLVGFSFGGVIAGLVAAQRAVRSLTLVGSGGLGVIRGGNRLERVRDKQGAEREAAHRTNLHRWMIADPARIDPAAVAIQDWSSRHARFDSRPFGRGDALIRALPRVQGRIAGIWGALDHAVQGETARPRAVLQAIRPGTPFHVVANAGHWVAFEAPEAFAAALRHVLTPAHNATERPLHEHA
jgi:pimeloyl-ACP methyl ester carboxylesterase